MAQHHTVSEPVVSARDDLIDAYFERVDAETFDRFTDVFDPDVDFYPLGEPVSGVDALIDWYESSVSLSDMTHETGRRLHHPAATVVQGRLHARVSGETELEGRFIDVFEFDDETDAITSLAIYIGLQPHID